MGVVGVDVGVSVSFSVFEGNLAVLFEFSLDLEWDFAGEPFVVRGCVFGDQRYAGMDGEESAAPCCNWLFFANW